ncbi:hypothetical protein G9A89_023100 [Geosiphon pyriformis]|nr:hypothetical protein G9A89_023100 [Geosiphon pyriformis]
MSSMGGLSDLKNIKNTVTKETSYADLNDFVINGIEDNTMPRKTCTHTYVLSQPLKTFSFNILSDNKDMVVLLPPKFKSSNQLLIDGFGEAFALSKFLEIIRLSFTFEFSLNKTKKLAICKKIIVNDNLKKVNNHSDWEVIIRKILIDLFKSAIKSVFSKFEKIISIKMQLIVIDDKHMWISRDQHQALLYTLPIGTTAHDLLGLLDSYGKKTCFIGHNPAGFSLACCAKCKQFGHISNNQVCLVGIYKKKQASIVCLVLFGRKTWAQITGSFPFSVVPLVTSGAKPSPDADFTPLMPNSLVVSGLNNRLASLKCFLGLLADQVSGILRKLSFVDLVPLASSFLASLFVVFVSLTVGVGLNIVLNSVLVPFVSLFSAVSDGVFNLNFSSSKILTNKVSGLKSKLASLEASIESVLARLNYLCSGSDFLLPLLSQ